MIKQVLIDRIYKKISEEEPYSNHTKKEIDLIYNAFIETICEELEEESKYVNWINRNRTIHIPLLGNFNLAYQEAHTGRNPFTKAKLRIKDMIRIYYKPNSRIKNLINKNK